MSLYYHDLQIFQESYAYSYKILFLIFVNPKFLFKNDMWKASARIEKWELRIDRGSIVIWTESMMFNR